MSFNLNTCELICSTLILIHNFIITENLKGSNKNKYLKYKYQGRRRNGVDELDDRILDNSNEQRNLLKEYFSSPMGKVSWQDHCIRTDINKYQQN